MGAFVEMSRDVSHICRTTAHDFAQIHVSYYNDDAKRTKAMYRQRTQHPESLGAHTAHRGWDRLLLDRARDLISKAQRTAAPTANGAAMPAAYSQQTRKRQRLPFLL